MKYTIGIDLGGTTMTAGLVDEAYNIVGKITRPTRLPRPAQDLEQALADLCPVLLPKTAKLILQMSAMWASVPRAV